MNNLENFTMEKILVEIGKAAAVAAVSTAVSKFLKWLEE
ncbi:hypothetical protein SAMN05720470_11148 [Fibrobacter sp. UWOV1]|nr:hypothetical protein SAMN05720470_11148 [Fibrobacter sp. UWOV1]